MNWRALLVVPLLRGVGSIRFDPIERLEINPSILPQDVTSTFADVRTEGGLLDWQSYTLSIDSAPDAKTMADSPAYQGLLVRGPNGADYKCFIPASQAGAEAAAHGAAGAGHEPSLKHLKGGIARLRASCLQSQGGYWSYEVCPFRHIRQFHREFKKGSLASKLSDSAAGAGVRSGQGTGLVEGTFAGILQSILGRNEQEVISEDILLGRYIPEASNDHLANGVYVQSYIDGDRCHYGEPLARIAEVKYECSLGKPIDHIISVTEVSSCHYSIRIGTPKICATDAVLPRPVSSITCVKASTVQHWLETAWEPKKAPAASDGPVTGRSTSQDSMRADGTLFWKQRLRHFIAHDRSEYPIIHKLVMEFMQAEHMHQPDSEEDIPDVLVKKWLLLLGIDDESIARDSPTPGNRTDAQEGRDG